MVTGWMTGKEINKKKKQSEELKKKSHNRTRAEHLRTVDGRRAGRWPCVPAHGAMMNSTVTHCNGGEDGGRVEGWRGRTGRERLMNVSGHDGKKKLHLGSCCHGYRLSSAPACTLAHTHANRGEPSLAPLREQDGRGRNHQTFFFFFLMGKKNAVWHCAALRWGRWVCSSSWQGTRSWKSGFNPFVSK